MKKIKVGGVIELGLILKTGYSTASFKAGTIRPVLGGCGDDAVYVLDNLNLNKNYGLVLYLNKEVKIVARMRIKSLKNG